MRFQPGQQIIPEGLVILQELPVIRHRIPVCGHVGGKAGQIPEQVEGLGVKQGCLQEHGQIGVILLSQNLQQGVLQELCPAADVLVVHIGHLAIGELGKHVGEGGGVEGAQVQFIVMNAEAPDILVGVVTQAGAQITQGTLREIGVVVLAADLLEVLLCIHAVEIDGVIQVVVQMFKVAGGRHGRQVQHGVVVGAQVEVAVVNPHVASHGIVDAQAKTVFAVVADDLGPGEGAVRLLFATVHGEALLIGDAGLFVRFVCDHGYVQVAVILNDVPDAAAVEAVDLHHGRQAIEIVLVGNDPPGVQGGAGIGAGHNEAARRALPVVVVCGQAHENLSIINQQAVHAVGDAPGLIDVIVYNLGLIGDRIYFHQGSCGVAHTGEVQLPLELEGHPVAGEIVFHCHGGGIAREDVGMLAPDVPLPENHLGLAGDLVDRHDHRGPVVHQGGVKSIDAEGYLDNFIGDLPGIQLRVQNAGALHPIQGGFYIVVVDVVGGIVAGPDVHIVSRFCHGPGVALSAILQVASENAVHLTGTQSGMGDFVNGVAAVGIEPLLIGAVADVALFVGVNAVVGQSRGGQHTHRQEERHQFCSGFPNLHISSPVTKI